MKVEELMIGDWVVNVNNDNEPCRIETLGKCDVDTDGLDEVSYERLTPIPITQEILEKNGFKSRHWNNMYFNTYDLFLNENTEQITVNLNANTIFCRKGVEYYPNQKISINGSYVHELQHALKLCGIDKEIEL